MSSPWERALGRSIEQLDPGLRGYFGQIPLGMVGRGAGVFDVVGTQKRWLWPILAVLALDGIVFPAWQRQVPFTVTNRPGRRGTIDAKRLFEFAETSWVMTDRIGVTRAGLVDRLGRSGSLEARLDASVESGALVLRSTVVTVRLGFIRVPLGVLSPRLKLLERRDGDRQHVSLRLSLPVIGTLYEYSGSFSYRVQADD